MVALEFQFFLFNVTDFEHVMGSLVFLGHSLKGTPYADLALDIPSCSANSDRHHSASSGETQQREGNEERSSAMSDPSAGGVALPLLPLVGLSTGQMDWCHQPSQQEGDEEAVAAAEEEEEDNDTPNAFVRAAHLFGTVACAQLGLSSIDPLRTAFASGLRVLPKLQSLQRAIAWLTKYSSSDSSNTLPVPVELESIAQRHNIFHCPVIKEVANMTNTPVRLTCGHAISRDAFNSLASSDRSIYTFSPDVCDIPRLKPIQFLTRRQFVDLVLCSLLPPDGIVGQPVPSYLLSFNHPPALLLSLSLSLSDLSLLYF
ncbi:unnamed protein product [Schistocephalus solidus]|uniref:Protein-tyrosine-phosphatase n=1 Tax=Schistocephalus solidus TaxID=70667 RepID=A0A183THK2_SCHSO|nr:unnamed protein product [Schistocephalus solidus]